jgi:hypothetical protein
MERLHPINVLALVTTCLAIGSSALLGESCSLAVKVLLPDGRRVEAPVSVREENGRLEEHEHEDSDVIFCDLGILPVTVTVGSDGLCNQVIIRRVPISLDRTYHLTVTYDPLACGETVISQILTCKILFRVADSIGNWQAQAKLRISSPISTDLTTDSFGRVGFVARAGDEVRGTAESTGHSPKSFSFNCTRAEPRIERYIQFEK